MVCDVDLAAVFAHDFAHKAQTQTRAFVRVRVCVWACERVKTVEYLRQCVLGNANTVITNEQLMAAQAGFIVQLNLPAIGGKINRVVQHIDEGLGEQQFVRLDLRVMVQLHLQLNAALRQFDLHALCCAVNHFVQCDAFGLQGRRTLNARQLQQPIHQQLQASGLLLNGGGEALTHCLRRMLLQQFGGAFNRGQRAFELMREAVYIVFHIGFAFQLLAHLFD